MLLLREDRAVADQSESSERPDIAGSATQMSTQREGALLELGEVALPCDYESYALINSILDLMLDDRLWQ